MEVQLMSLSPVSFMIAKVGERVRIKHNLPRLNEYREKIGPATESYLVFKGQTKIGMIPPDVVKRYKDLLILKSCLITKIDHAKSNIMVAIDEAQTSQTVILN